MTQMIYYPETTGLVNQIDGDKNKKLFFFEIDSRDQDLIDRILEVYRQHSITVLYHQTKNGYHFLSPTLLSLSLWKYLHELLKDINPKCPMITLRVQANKYPNEDQYFYRFETRNPNPLCNVKSVCLYLNKIFGSNLQGELSGDIQLVKYRPHQRNHL